MGTKIWRKIRRAFTFAVAIALAGEVINCSAMVAQAADAQFYIRYDGEPTKEEHAATGDYSAGILGTISDDVLVRDENENLQKSNWYYNENGLNLDEYGIDSPELSEFSGDFKLQQQGVDFENATIAWYIIKYESDNKIHVDGVIKNNIPTPTPEPSDEPTPSAEPTPTPVPVTPEVPNTPVTPNVPDTTTETVEVPAAQAQAEPAEPAPVNEVEAQEPQENEAEADAEENEPAVEPVENDENEVEI